jgi:4-hydroxybenzoate polyprenyltransferase
MALAAVPALLAAAITIAVPLGAGSVGIVVSYFVVMTAYSIGLKDHALVDVLILAMGYAARVAMGALAVQIAPSPWLLAFCLLLFFSLALIKRYAELSLLRERDGLNARARAYRLEDQSLLAALGVSTGTLSVLVLALYTSSEKSAHLYTHPVVVSVTCALLLYWISHLWLTAHRGEMPDDPVLFVLRDRVSRVLIALMAVTWIAL